jgi:phosphomannomutase
MVTLESPASSIALTLPGSRWAEFESFAQQFKSSCTVAIEADTAALTFLVDGVKVGNGLEWALALPDPAEPVTHLWAEAGSAAEARALSKDYARRIRRLVR